MERNREALARAGIRFGRSRLAVRGNLPSADGGCVYCRLCMYGCPYGYIYTSADTVAQLLGNPNFSYQSGVIIDQVRESAQGAEVLGYERATRRPLAWQGSRAFLAAGTIATTRILLRSLGAYDQTAWLKDSQYFLLPLRPAPKGPGRHARMVARPQPGLSGNVRPAQARTRARMCRSTRTTT